MRHAGGGRRDGRRTSTQAAARGARRAEGTPIGRDPGARAPASTSSTARPSAEPHTAGRRRAAALAQRAAAERARRLHRPPQAEAASSSSGATALEPRARIDWAHAEALAFASLLHQGVPIRLTGQDAERGTFSQRHLVLHDPKTGQALHADPAPAERARAVRAAQQPAVGGGLRSASSTATRAGARGARALGGAVRRLRERRAGDHRPVHRLRPRQVGPDHAPDAAAAARLRGLRARSTPAARLERFLQLAAEGNIRVANCTTPAQYFHLLRRQALIAKQRPLVVMTPKSLLRLPQATRTASRS